MNIVFMSMDTLPSTLWARDLYDQMHIRSDFRKWFLRMCQYGFIEGRDYENMPRVRLQDEGGRTVQRYVKDYRMDHIMYATKGNIKAEGKELDMANKAMIIESISESEIHFFTKDNKELTKVPDDCILCSVKIYDYFYGDRRIPGNRCHESHRNYGL